LSDRGKVQLTVANAEGDGFQGDLFVQIQDENERVLYAKRKRYEVPTVFTNLRGAPNGRHLIHVKSEIHCPMSSYVMVTADQTLPLSFQLLIDSDVSDRNGPKISYPTAPDALPGMGSVFAQPFSTLIKSSAQFQIPREQGENGGMNYYGGLVKGKTTNNNHRRLACLLNLHKKMTNTNIMAGQSAWGLIHSIFAIEQDRIWAQVSEQDMNVLFAELDRRWDHSGGHNIEPPAGFKKREPTYKSTKTYNLGNGDAATGDKTANLQLSFASKTVEGETVWIVDADVDEKTGWDHAFGEAVPHFFTGGKTNPYVVHQLLCTKNLKPAYDLVVA
jgi:hypothetical protein